jgi:hypothetical protein
MRGTPNHNTGGLAFWFLRAERYEPEHGVIFPSVRKRCRELESTSPKAGARGKRYLGNGRSGKSVDLGRGADSKPRRGK